LILRLGTKTIGVAMRPTRTKLLAAAAALLLIGTGVTFLLQPGFEEAGCACEPPPTLEEVSALIEIAKKGDFAESILATGQVWQAYEQREDRANADLWKAKAIAVGDPVTLNNIADDMMMSVNDIKDKSEQLRVMREALVMLERAYPRRSLLPDFWSVYVNSIRAARGSIAVAEDGVGVWTERANSGDAAAAHNLATYYFHFPLDQEKRSFWEKRAAELGDPTFAWSEACCWRKTAAELAEGKKYITAAKNNPDAWKNAGDVWMQGVLAAELDEAEAQIDRRLAAIR
jgi:hypothetical protein